MTIGENERGVTIITADEGKALKRKTDTATKTRITRVALAASDSADNWQDCDYGEDVETRYSVRSIIRELKAIGKFDAVRSLLEQANYDWDFIGSNYLSSTDSDFQTMMAAIVSQGILTQAELDALLPTCIWEQTPMS